MGERITLQLTEIIGSTLCVSADDGEKVFQQINQALQDGQEIRLSFLNVESLTSAFLNAAIGQLYGSYTPEQLRASLSVNEIDADDRVLLSRVIETAKLYFSKPQILDDARKQALEEDPDEEYNV